MITIFDLIRVLLALVLTVVSARCGAALAGVWGGVAGAGVGLWVGWWLGDVPWRLAARATARELSRMPTEELLADLRGHRTLMPNFVLLELARRGHDIEGEVPVVLDLLASDQPARRTLGWAALTSAFTTSRAS